MRISSFFPLLLILGIYCLVNGQMCNRKVAALLLRLTNCQIACIRFNTTSGCYTCNSDCNQRNIGKSKANDTCILTLDSTIDTGCSNNEVCLANGIIGQNSCVNRTDDGESCGRSNNDGDGLDDDLTERMEDMDLTSGILERLIISSISRAVVPCRKGSVCSRESLTTKVCRLVNQTDCSMEKLRNSEISCDEEGYYEALQCRRQANRLSCQCVSKNGTIIEGTERTVSSIRGAPDCRNRKCSYVTRLGYRYQATSGTSFIDYGKCARCLCSAGEAEFCSSLNTAVCNTINPSPKADRSCSVRGQMIPDGQSISIGCTRCGCRNGQVQCLKRVCEDEKDNDPVDEEDQNCQACRNMAVHSVCGNDGKTYPSECVATYCRGLNASDITSGPCKTKDICRAYQCTNDTEVCVRKGGVTCLSRSGCRNAQRFRGCINLQSLQCNSTASNASTVCGSDGNSYTSLCTLLQSAAGIRALYGTRCDATQCSDGQVCGTDGETYGNICELEAQSANARVDYRGQCMETEPDTLEKDRCQKIRDNGKCENLSNCKTAVRPDDGCCPICGGGLTVGFDRNALEEYLTANPSVETVDDLMVRAFLSGFISEEDRNRCEVKGSLSNEGNLFIALEAKQKSEDYCNNLAKRLEDTINNPTSSVSTSVPQEFQFATVAESSALISEDPTGSGEQAIVRNISFTLLLMCLLMIYFLA